MYRIIKKPWESVHFGILHVPIFIMSNLGWILIKLDELLTAIYAIAVGGFTIFKLRALKFENFDLKYDSIITIFSPLVAMKGLSWA